MLKQLKPTVSKNPFLKKFRNRMRRRPTPAELALTKVLRSVKSLKFSRQEVFRDEQTGTSYIADFWLWTHRVVVECDGCQHYTREGRLSDSERDAAFARAGIRTIRIGNRLAMTITKRELLDLLAE